MKKQKFTYLNCNKHREKFPGMCKFSNNSDKVVYCTASSSCGLPKKR